MFHILHPFYLFGLSIASLPLILHLLGRRRIREHPFSSLFLLKEINKSSSVWMRIKELILLLLRILFIIFIVTAFSHPLVLSPLPFLGKPAPKEIAILIDVSMSMGMEDAINHAKQEAIRIFKTQGRGNRTTIISFSDRIEEEKEILDESVLQSFLETLAVTYRGTDIIPALEMAKKTLLKKNGFTKELFIISDFQKTGLENIESVFSRIQKNGIHIYVSIIERSDKNIYFPNWSIEPPFPLPGLRLTLYPQLALTENGSYPVELFFQGVKKGAKKVSQNDKNISFQLESGNAGYRTGFFRIKGDALDLDNTYFFSFHVPENLKVLLVGSGNDLEYLSAALRPGIKTPVKLQIVEPAELRKVNPNQHDVLILYNTRIDGYVKARTLDFLAHGGGVLCVMGNQFLPDVGKIIFDEIQISKKNNAAQGFFSIKSVDTGFPPLSNFKGKGLKNLYDTKITQYFTIKTDLRTIIEAKNADPLAVTGNINNGKIILFPFAFDSEWSQLPLKGIFVPLIYRMIFHLASREEKLPEFKVGDPIKISTETKSEFPLFILPDKSKKSAIRTDTGNGYILKHTTIPGIYSFVPQPGETIPVAVNVKEEESKLQSATFEELKRLFPYIRESVATQKIAGSGKRWVDLFPFLLILSLLVLAAELILENK